MKERKKQKEGDRERGKEIKRGRQEERGGERDKKKERERGREKERVKRNREKERGRERERESQMEREIKRKRKWEVCRKWTTRFPKFVNSKLCCGVLLVLIECDIHVWPTCIWICVELCGVLKHPIPKHYAWPHRAPSRFHMAVVLHQCISMGATTLRESVNVEADPIAAS